MFYIYTIYILFILLIHILIVPLCVIIYTVIYSTDIHILLHYTLHLIYTIHIPYTLFLISYIEMGFRLIFNDLVNCHKPIVGHNCMYDIMFLLRWLEKGPLETELSQFKSKIHDLLPYTFDTKYIAESGLIKGQNYDRTSLSDLYSQMKESLTWTTLPPFSPPTTTTATAATVSHDINVADTTGTNTTTTAATAVTDTILHTLDTAEPTPLSTPEPIRIPLSPISFTFSPDTPKYTPSSTTSTTTSTPSSTNQHPLTSSSTSHLNTDPNTASNTTSSVVKEQFHDAG